VIFRRLKAPSYVPLRAKQLLFETFLPIGFSFRDIGLDHLKWDTLYIYIHIYIYVGGGGARARVYMYKIITLYNYTIIYVNFKYTKLYT